MPLAADRTSISVAPVRFRRNRWLARRHSGRPTGMLLRAIVVAICGLALVLAGAAAHAQVGGNLTAGPPLDIHLEIATGSDGPVLSTTAFDLVTGEYYRLNVTSDGVEPWRLEVDELLRNSHLRLVTINGIEVHLQALAFRAIEFDVAGTAQFSFTPIRTGERSTALSAGCCRIRRAREASRTGRTAGAGRLPGNGRYAGSRPGPVASGTAQLTAVLARLGVGGLRSIGGMSRTVLELS